MKKYISLILAAVICLTLCACSQQEPDNSSDELKTLLTDISEKLDKLEDLDKLDDLAKEEPAVRLEKPLDGTYKYTFSGDYQNFTLIFEFTPDGSCRLIDPDNYTHMSGEYEGTETGWRIFMTSGTYGVYGNYYEIEADGENLSITGTISSYNVKTYLFVKQ